MRAGRATLERACPHEDPTPDTHANWGKHQRKGKEEMEEVGWREKANEPKGS